MDYLSRLFVQSATWTEVLPQTSSLTEEQTKDHVLDRIRVSVETVGRSADSYGMSDQSNATLYFLVGTSTTDGDIGIPAFKEGDEITTSIRKWTVVSTNFCQTLRGDRNHLEVRLT